MSTYNEFPIVQQGTPTVELITKTVDPAGFDALNSDSDENSDNEIILEQ